MRFAKLIYVFVTCFFFMAMASVGAAQTEKVAHLRPIAGSRMVVGNGDVKEYTLKCFVHLCNEALPNIAVINLDGKARVTEADLKKYGAGSVTVIDSLAIDAKSLALKLLDVSGVWIEGNVDAIIKDDFLVALLKNSMKRNGVVAVGSSSEALLANLGENAPAKRLESPFAKFDFHFGKEATANAVEAGNAVQKVHCFVPDASVAVFHGGRRIAGYGNDDISLFVGKNNGWPERRASFECPDVFNSGSYPFYGLDLFSWVRSANERGRDLFPPKVAATPELASGALVLNGGSAVPDNVMKEFVELAGGKDAWIVCIPSAQRFDFPDLPDSYGARRLQEMGHKKYITLHNNDPLVADTSEEYAELLKQASGVWIDGGRTYRFMDCYQGTQVERLIADVLKRGGVVGGNSAGCQVPSDFLVRGNPRTNKAIVHEGYTRGMGLLKGVILDAHFLQRGRHEPFLKLMKNHPQMLGIGVDEKTAIVVKGHSAMVIGENAVSFYDLQAEGDVKPAILKAGEEYDLKSRKTKR